MRLLLNHGISPSDLYLNVPAKVSKLTRSIFRKRGYNAKSREDFFGQILCICFGYILETMIKEHKRFYFQSNSSTYIDFEVVLEDEFEHHRQLGRFQEIDFISSDFTSYNIRAFYKIHGVRRKQKVFLGSYLKELFIETVNSGEKLYTIQDFTLDYILNKVHSEFSWIPKEELQSILKFGLKRLELVIRGGLSASFASRLSKHYYIHIGDISLNEKRQINLYKYFMDKKHRRIYTWAKTPYDGYYYIGLSRDKFGEWLALNKNSVSIVKFDKVFARKIKEELFYRYSRVYMFRIPVKENRGWKYMLYKNDKIRDVEYIGFSEKLKYTPDSLGWKELIKKYEKRNC